jgi:putative transposase
MARRPRVEMMGYHHVINRGVDKRVIFLDSQDNQTFLEYLCNACSQYAINLHSYCLMSNRYHLLVETSMLMLIKQSVEKIYIK